MKEILVAMPITTRSQKITTAIFALVILIPSLLGFANKFREFLLLASGDVDGTFAITPILNYLLASLGFFCLFCWAILHGMFRDIEGPKALLLETERLLDEGPIRHGRKGDNHHA
jgi:hypothetical protein